MRNNIIWNNYFLKVVLVVLLLACTNTVKAETSFSIIQVTNNDFGDYEPQVNDKIVVWQCYTGSTGGTNSNIFAEICMYDVSTGTTTQITDNDYYDSSPVIDNGKIVWYGGNTDNWDTMEIFLYDLSLEMITQITNDNYRDINPQISDGKIVWQADENNKIFLHDITSGETKQIIDGYANAKLRIDGDKLVWMCHDYNDWEICLYDIPTETTVQITNNDFKDEEPQIEDGKIVWYGDFTNANNLEIYLYDLSSEIITQITNNNYPDRFPTIDDGIIVWYGGYDHINNEIYLYDTSTGVTTQITNNGYCDWYPKINNGKIVWMGQKSGKMDIFLYDIYSGIITQITDNILSADRVMIDNGIIVINGVVAGGDNHEVILSQINTPPTIDSITAPIIPVPINTEITVSVSFTDPDLLDIHSIEWDWGDGTIPGIVTVTDGERSATKTHSYNMPGIYTVSLTVTDNNSGADSKESTQYVVIYDPNGGFVTGGGWIESPLGAYKDNPNVEGKASFGFVSKYMNGASTPSGQTEFQFKVANLNFHSDSYDWLVVAGSKAMYKGTGTINGAGNYGFMISAIDEELTPSIDVDLFRIKLWDKENNDEVVYDNQMGDAENADPTTTIAGGQIKIHKE